MKTSAVGRALIVQREGRRLVAYRDTRGILTIGVGHTGRMSAPPVTVGMTIGEAQCDALLAADLAPIEAVIASAVKVPLSQNEFDALASLGFNIGAAGLKRSSVVKRLNLGDVQGAAQAFLAWSKPAVLAGRRRAEMRQFLEPDAAAIETSPTLAAARTTALRKAAATTRAKAKIAENGAAALVAGGSATGLLAHLYHPSLAFVVAGVGVGAGLLALAAAILGHRHADTLVRNAGRQTAKT